MNTPNIIFIFSDQQRWDTVGAYGQELDITPNIDKMSKEGVRFENAFTCQPVCGPARACLQTGKYATELGCFMNGIALPEKEKTIADYFNEAGYKTAYVGKWHLASTSGITNYTRSAVPLEKRGGYKDYWVAADVLEFTSDSKGGYMFDKDMNKVEFEGYRADCTTDFALDFLKHQDGKQPFFLFISYIEPHHQNNHNRFEGPEGSKEKFKDFILPKDLENKSGDYNEQYPDYLGACNSIDYNVGRIRKQLNDGGLEDNTIIIYTSDHGCHFKTRNSEYKRSCHESSIRIPMVICGGKFKGNKVIDNLVSLIDVPPTLLELAGITGYRQMKGRNLQELLNDNVEWEDEVFLQISESQVGRCIRTKRWKYLIVADDKNPIKDMNSDVYYEDSLYDLENDYEEKNNIIDNDEFNDIKEQLKKRMIIRMAQAGEPPCEIRKR